MEARKRGSHLSLRPLILMRFSYVTNTNLADHFGTQEEFRAYLYDKKRMEYRFWLFENFCLPSLLHQSDPNFVLVLLTSPELPDWCKKRLEEIVAPLQYLIAYEPVMTRNQAFKKIIEESFPNHDGQQITIRLDDDDAIGKDWIKCVKDTAQQTQFLLPYNQNYAIYPSSGAVLNLNSNDAPLIAVHAKLPSSAGLALVTSPKSKETAYNFEHLEASIKRPTISIPAPYSFLRVLHDTNISHLQKGSQLRMLRNLNIEPLDVQKAMMDEFYIDLDCLDEMPDFHDPLIVPKSA